MDILLVSGLLKIKRNFACNPIKIHTELGQESRKQHQEYYEETVENDLFYGFQHIKSKGKLVAIYPQFNIFHYSHVAPFLKNVNAVTVLVPNNRNKQKNFKNAIYCD